MAKALRRSRLRCYLSSPFLVDTKPLRRVLQDLEVDVGSIEDLPPAGQMLSGLLTEQIQSASFVLGVLSADEGAAVLFEIGVATGLGKPVFLIADDEERLPSSLLSLPFVAASLTDAETIRFHLEAFIASLAFPRKATSVKPPLGFYGGGEMVPVQRPGRRSSGSRSELRVEAAFRQAGASVTVSPQIGEGTEADMIVWLPDADLGLGGPLLVEVKSAATETFPENALRQVRRLFARSHLRAAVLVTNSPEKGVSGRIVEGAFVYSVSIPELERFAGAGKLGLELKRLRNRLAHGAA